jgi:uncharacterized protein
MRILLTGGTGLIGRQLCAALLAVGHEVWVLSRTPEIVKARCGALARALATLDEWTPEETFDAVINLAGAPIVDKRWTEQRKKILWESRIALTEALIGAIARAKRKPTVLLSGSAIGYYGDCGDALLTESATAARDFGAELCVAWEQAAQKAAAFKVRVCLLRTGLVLDASGGMIGRMLLPFNLGLGARLGDGRQWMSWIHIDDYVAIVLRLLETTTANGSFNMTAPTPVTNAEFTKTLARVLHRPAFLVAPAKLLQLALGEMSTLLIGGQRVIPSKAEASGYRFVHPQLEGALRSLLG